jgi:hypothetical protein
MTTISVTVGVSNLPLATKLPFFNPSLFNKTQRNEMPSAASGVLK